MGVTQGEEMGVAMGLESKRERIEIALSDVECGPEEERESLEEILRSMPGAVEDSLKIMKACRDVEILDLKVGNGIIAVRFKCDGEVYRARWSWEKICIYTVRFSELE
jgi:hypothetical protein